jgi:hypothetical protein
VNKTWPLYAAAVAIVLVASVVMAAYTVELGIAKPGTNPRRVVVAAAEIDRTLDGDASFLEFSESLYAALVAHRLMPVRNPADNRIDHALAAALDCYTALRESWQMELEGTWNPAIQGDAAYWRSFHPLVALPGSGQLEPDTLRAALRAEAAGHVADALAVIER